MKRIKRTIQIELETERSIVFACRRRSVRWCPKCNLEIPFVSVSEVAALIGLSESKLIENQQLHIAQEADGQFLVCCNSVNKSPQIS